MTCSRRTVRDTVLIGPIIDHRFPLRKNATRRSGSDSRAPATSAGDDGVRQLADPVDLDRDGVTRLEQALWVAEDTDTRRRPRQDQVTGLERRRARRVADDLVDPEDQVGSRRVLEYLAVDDRANRERVRVADLRRGHERPDRAERVRGLAARPLPVGELEIPSRDVVCAEVTAYGLERVLLRHVLARRADDDAELRLVVAFRDDGRDHDRVTRPDQRGRVLREEERRGRELDTLLLRVVLVVEPDADDLAGSLDRHHVADPSGRSIVDAGSRLGLMPIAPQVVAELRATLGDEHVIDDPEQLRVYDCDGLTGWRALPSLVVLPGSTEDVQAVVRVCHRQGIPFVARGAGTGLSGGALPVTDGIVVALTRLDRILEVDLDAERVVVEPGVANLDVTRAVAAEGYFYAPDPSSQQVCTIGGNVAENSGGAHCLKNGFTVHHVTGLTVVLPDGELVELGGKALDPDGYDLLGVFVGSEGTLGIATRVTLRIVRAPERVLTLLAGFHSTDDAGAAVSEIVGSGIVPAAIEMMDRLTIEAAELAFSPGYPVGAGAVLLVELDGISAQVDDDESVVRDVLDSCGSFEVRAATDDADRALLWKGRKGAFPAMGRMSPQYYVQDGVVPRTRLPDVLRRIDELSTEYGLRVGNVFHAGDGNLHPLVLYDDAAGETERAKELAEAILTACMDAGGSLTGEHGVGVDKACAMPQMFSELDLAAFGRLRRAFDPDGLANPGKVIPTPRLCGEVPGPHRIHPLEALGVGDRF